MTPAQKKKRIAHLKAERVKQQAIFDKVKEEDPFWLFEPSNGEVPEEGQKLLEKYLKPEDIPQVLLSQLDVFKSEADIIADFGGNQGGKTTLACIMSFIWAVAAIPLKLRGVIPESMIPTEFPQHIRVTGVDWKTMLSNILPTWRKWAPKEFLKNGSFDKSYSAEERTLSLYEDGKLKGTIEFMTNQQSVESFQGPPRHGMIYDEEPKYEIYQENLARFTTAKRMKQLFTMTPTKGLSWVHEDIVLRSETDKGENIECFKVPSVTNRMANYEVLSLILDGLSSYDSIKMRLLGEFTSLGGLVYGGLFQPKIHVIKPFDIKYDDFTVYRGLDPHLVKPSCCIELAVDREGNEYVVGTYLEAKDTDDIKKDLAKRAKDRGYRLAWTICDKSADSSMTVFGDRNIYRELKFGENAVPALCQSIKFDGSIRAGVDEIKKLLKVVEKTNLPRLFIFDIPENKTLINAMRTLERYRTQNEHVRGVKDKIEEGKHDTHACLRYIHQKPIRWINPVEYVPEYEPVNDAVGY